MYNAWYLNLFSCYCSFYHNIYIITFKHSLSNEYFVEY
jgi:hypothetical protein